MRVNRKTNPRVIDGRVQKKNNDRPTHNYYNHVEPELVIDRRRPGPEARHLLMVEDIKTFISIIPNWAELSRGIDAVLLVPYDDNYFGLYNYAGVIKISAWPVELWIEIGEGLNPRKDWLMKTLAVETEDLSYGGYLAKFTENNGPNSSAAKSKHYQGRHSHPKRLRTDAKTAVCNRLEPTANSPS